MTEVHMIPDTPDKEVDWTVDPDAGRELAAASATPALLHEVNRNFSRNVFATILARVVNMLRGVVLVPFLLYHLGLEAYGIWTTIFILVSYVGVTTLGLSNVYIKYVAEFHARREYDKANALLSTGLAITIPLCTAIFLAFLFGWKWYSPWLHLPPAHAVHRAQRIRRRSRRFPTDRRHAMVPDSGHSCGVRGHSVAGGRRTRHPRIGRGLPDPHHRR